MIRLTLPYPPTANNLFGNGSKGRFRTAVYNGWIKAAGWSLNVQRPGCIDGAYHLKITAERPDLRARDIDNLIKPLSDLLKKHGVIADDSKALSVFAEWSANAPSRAAKVHVSLWPPLADGALGAPGADANPANGLNEHPSLAANALRSPANLPQTEKVPA
jgi:crossover junction endodeoxyribonuclease RusA